MRCLWRRQPRLNSLRKKCLPTCLLTALLTLILAEPGSVCAQGQPAGSSGGAQITKAVGTIKSIQADSITIAAESGGEGDIFAKLMGSTKILRVPPGEKDLKNATALQAQDLQPGDRVLVRGQASTDGDGHTIVALAVIVMKQADVAAEQQRDRDDWQSEGWAGSSLTSTPRPEPSQFHPAEWGRTGVSPSTLPRVRSCAATHPIR